MKQRFTGDIGQVAGGDIKTNSARAHVDLHIHHGLDVNYVTDGQHEAIARQAIQLEAGAEKGIVYRPLMSVSSASSLNTVTRHTARTPWIAMVSAGSAIAALATAAYVLVKHTSAPPVLALEHAMRCEYGGDRYSIGSVVMQAGVRQQCVSSGGQAAAWHPVARGNP